MNKPPVSKTLTWVYSAVAAFTVLSIVVPILWERGARKAEK